MKSNEAELIVEHALQNESNLVLAVKISEAYPRLREEVIRRVLGRLRVEMRTTLGTSWVVEIEENEGSSPYLYIKGQTWPADVMIGIGSDNGCRTWVYVWVMKCSATLANALLDDELKGVLEKFLNKPWKSSPSSLWHVLDKYRDWGVGDTLVEIYRASDAMDYVRALLLEIHGIVAPIIDRALFERQPGSNSFHTEATELFSEVSPESRNS